MWAPQVMQEWLNERKLDRKALTALSVNLAAVEAWEEYVREEAAALLHSLVAAVAGEEDPAAVDDDSDDALPGASASASDAEDEEFADAEGMADLANGTAEGVRSFPLLICCLASRT